MIRFTAFILGASALVACDSPRAPEPIQRATGSWAAGSAAGARDLLAIDMLDATHGWAVGDISPTGGAIFATSDGGKSWNTVAQTNEVLAGVHFVSLTRGWVVGYAGRIERTDDSGRTWKIQRLEHEGEVLNSVFFLDENHGFVVGGSGALLKTVNAGDTWEPIKTDRVEDLWSIRFANSERGWIVGEDGLILGTMDGGTTWARQESGTQSALTGLAVSPPSHAIAVGEGGTIVVSEDRASWHIVESGTPETLTSIASAGDIAWAVGYSGITIGSGDGGKTWSTAQSPSNSALLAVDMAAPTIGVAVGRKGFTQTLQ